MAHTTYTLGYWVLKRKDDTEVTVNVTTIAAAKFISNNLDALHLKGWYIDR